MELLIMQFLFPPSCYFLRLNPKCLKRVYSNSMKCATANDKTPSATSRQKLVRFIMRADARIQNNGGRLWCVLWNYLYVMKNEIHCFLSSTVLSSSPCM